MPTYEYVCQKCSHRFETWQKMTDEPLTVCDECGGTIRRVLFPAGLVFKGSGFYKTDHGSSSTNGTNGHNGHKSKGEGEGASSETKASNESKSENGSKTSESKTTSAT